MRPELDRPTRRLASAMRRPEGGPFTAMIQSAEWDETNRLSIRVLPTGGEETLVINRLSTDVHAFASSPAPWGRLVLVQSIQGRLFAACLIEEAQ